MKSKERGFTDALVIYAHTRNVGGVHGGEFLVIPSKIKDHVHTSHLSLTRKKNGRTFRGSLCILGATNTTFRLHSIFQETKKAANSEQSSENEKML